MSDFAHILDYLSINWRVLVCLFNPYLHNYNVFKLK